MRMNHKMTLPTFYENHFVPSKSGGWSESTKSADSYRMYHYLFPEFDSLPMDRLDPHCLQVYLNTMAQNHSTLFAYGLMWSLRAMMRLAMTMGIISKDPTVKLEVPQIASPPKPIPSRDEVVTVLSVLEHPRDKCMFALIAFCRVAGAQLFGLCWGEYQDGLLRLSPSSRPLFVPECIQGYIADWRALCPDVSPGALMFPNSKGKAFSQCSVFLAARIYPVARRVGIPDCSVGFYALHRAAAVRSFPRRGDIETALSVYLRGNDNDGVLLNPGLRNNAASEASPASS